jgi:hypothetical protein
MHIVRIFFPLRAVSSREAWLSATGEAIGFRISLPVVRASSYLQGRDDLWKDRGFNSLVAASIARIAGIVFARPCESRFFLTRNDPAAISVLDGLLRPSKKWSQPIQALGVTALKPTASIRYPPTQNAQRNTRSHSPPEWQRKIRDQTQDGPGGPEYLSLHTFILARIDTRQTALLQKGNTSVSVVEDGRDRRAHPLQRS